MSEQTSPEEIAKKKVVLTIPGMESVDVRSDVVFPGAGGERLLMDIYQPPAARAGALSPVVVLVAGYPDPGYERIFGRKFKEMGSCVSWARLAAASGLAAVAYANREPSADLAALLRHLRERGRALGIDGGRIGLLAFSGNAPVALSALLRETDRVACAAFLYGILLDLGGSTAVAESAAAFRFANPCAGRPLEDLRPDVPLFLARAGRDETPGLNATIDRFVTEALRLDLPLTLVNVPEGGHAFDLLDESEASRRVVREVLAFLRFYLLNSERDG